ncbi:MAG: hypothetical protein FD152_2653 [Xanthobacteraceae bacterium]|nr:MAG: hypothetical protein FD152_2653 [Xanthobacteraceae bacterium]
MSAALAEGDQVPGRRLPSYQTRLAAVEQAAGEDIEGQLHIVDVAAADLADETDRAGVEDEGLAIGLAADADALGLRDGTEGDVEDVVARPQAQQRLRIARFRNQSKGAVRLRLVAEDAPVKAFAHVLPAGAEARVERHLRAVGELRRQGGAAGQ